MAEQRVTEKGYKAKRVKVEIDMEGPDGLPIPTTYLEWKDDDLAELEVSTSFNRPAVATIGGDGLTSWFAPGKVVTFELKVKRTEK